MIQQIIKNFLTEHQISLKARFIVTVSGGADSISLLHAFKYLNLDILALHCNFSLRGKESDMDEQFVKRFCDEYGIALSVKKFDTTGYAKEHGISIEMAARDLRYNWFHEMKEKKKMDYIVVAHHADDLAETVLINLCRGTGIKGLTGIKAVNGEILRPLLSCPHADILKYISDHQLGYRTDSSNNSLEYMRNRIRHQVIPVMKEINPSLLNTFADTCRALKETEQIFEYGIQKLKEDIITHEGDETLIDIEKTLSSPAPYTLLFELLHPMGFNKFQIQDILDSSSAIPGKQFQGGIYTLTKGRTYWRIYRTRKDEEGTLLVTEAGSYTYNGDTFEIARFPKGEDFVISREKDMACLDADKVKFPVIIRHWKEGDYFCPLGMNRYKKKLSDYFSDCKFSTLQKKECLLAESEGQIIWVIDHRPDDRYKVTSFTKNILSIKHLTDKA